MENFSVRPPYVIKVFLSGLIHSHSSSVGFGSVGDLRSPVVNHFRSFLRSVKMGVNQAELCSPFFLKA